MKIFLHANQEEHPELRKYLAHVEGIKKLLETMAFQHGTLLNMPSLQLQLLSSLGLLSIRDSKQAEDFKRGVPDEGVYYLG